MKVEIGDIYFGEGKTWFVVDIGRKDVGWNWLKLQGENEVRFVKTYRDHTIVENGATKERFYRPEEM